MGAAYKYGNKSVMLERITIDGNDKTVFEVVNNNEKKY